MKTPYGLLPATAISRGIVPLLLLLGLLALAAALLYLQQMKEVLPDAVHRTEHGKRLDPWRPLPGCILLATAEGKRRYWAPDEATAAVCHARFGAAVVTDAVHLTADETGLAPLLRATALLRTPLQADPMLPQNTVTAGGASLSAGATLHLTLDADAQVRADRLLACLVGESDACTMVGIPPDTWQHHHENAAMRAGALLVLDITSGRIEVATNGRSLCYAAEEAGQPLPKGCPPSARAPGARPWKLANRALFADEMPGSLVKLPIMLALLRDHETGASLLQPGPMQERFVQDIRRSETANFLDRLFCRDRGYVGCSRLGELDRAAGDLGWNRPSPNLLALEGAPAAVYLRAPAARLLRQPNSTSSAWKPMSLRYRPERAQRCAEQPGDLRWSKCRDEVVANLVAELWGQGNARISPLAVAIALARIAAADNRQVSLAPPHLLAAAEGDRRRMVPQVESAGDTATIAPEHARLILKGMSQTHLPGGTAFTACQHAFGGDSQAMRMCVELKGVAGKTGTPVFNHDRLTVSARARHCAELREHEIRGGPAQQRAVRAALTQCQVVPLKWYAAVVRDDPRRADGPWSKVVVALAERNWRRDGRIDSSQDRGPNIAAELVFRYLDTRGR